MGARTLTSLFAAPPRDLWQDHSHLLRSPLPGLVKRPVASTIRQECPYVAKCSWHMLTLLSGWVWPEDRKRLLLSVVACRRTM
eukprot:5757390-Amphidinium_carterae.1